MIGTSLEQNGYLVQRHQILWKGCGFFSLFHIRCWFAACLYIHGLGLDCDSHQGMMNVEGLLTSFVAAGVLRSGVTPVDSEMPCHPYHWLISFGVKLVTNTISYWWGFSELLCCASWCQCSIWCRLRWAQNRRSVNCQVMGSVMGSV